MIGVELVTDKVKGVLQKLCLMFNWFYIQEKSWFQVLSCVMFY